MRAAVVAFATILGLSACDTSKSAAKDASECAVQAQRLYPHDVNAFDQSALGPGLPLTFEENCMAARGYKLDPTAPGCDPDGDKSALFKGVCYSGL